MGSDVAVNGEGAEDLADFRESGEDDGWYRTRKVDWIYNIKHSSIIF
jgi:hypothetical protein